MGKPGLPGPMGPCSQAPGETVSILAIALLAEAGLLGLALLMFWWTGLWPEIAFDPPSLAIGTGVGVACALLAVALFKWGGAAARGLRDNVQPLLERFGDASLFTLAVVALSAGIGEEALFRGAIQTWVGSWGGVHVGVIVASVLFGLVHAVSVRYAVYVTLVGLILGYLFLFTGSLVAAVLAHAVYDFVLLMWLLRAPTPHAPVPADA